MALGSDYLDYVLDLLAWVPGLAAKRMFGGAGLASHGRNFAVALDDTLYLKADGVNQAGFEAEGGERFRYLRQGRIRYMGYWSVPGDVLEDEMRLRAWTEAALAAADRAAATGTRPS